MKRIWSCLIALLLATAGPVWAQPLPALEEPQFTLLDLVNELEKHTDVVTLGDREGPMVVITPRVGGIVLGAAPGGLPDRNLLWVNPEIKNPAYWEKPSALIGGMRTNIAPQYGGPNKPVKDDGLGSVSGGVYQLVRLTEECARMSHPFHLKNEAGQEYRGIVTRTVTMLAPGLLPHAKGVKAVGFKLEYTLTNTGPVVWGKDVDPIGLWYIAMAPSGGTALAPVLPGGGAAWRDYTMDGLPRPVTDRVRQSDQVVAFRADSRLRSKIGIRPQRSRPWAAYLRQKGGDPGLLVVIGFPIDPGARYVDHPRGAAAGGGDIAQFYTGDGALGHYVEIENHSPELPLAPGETWGHMTMTWMFTGPVQTLKDLGSRIMSVDMNAVPYFEE